MTRNTPSSVRATSLPSLSKMRKEGAGSPFGFPTASLRTGDAAQGGWVGVTNHPAKLGDLLHRRAMRIECRVADADCCGRAKGLVFHSENLPCSQPLHAAVG